MSDEFFDKTSLSFIFKKYWKEIQYEIIKPIKEPVVIALFFVIPILIASFLGIFKAAFDAWENGFFVRDFFFISISPVLMVLFTQYSLTVGLAALSLFAPVREYIEYRVTSDLFASFLSGVVTFALVFMAYMPLIVLADIIGIEVFTD